MERRWHAKVAVAAVAALTVLSVAMLWAQAWDGQARWRAHVLDLSELRSAQLAEAVGGQVESQLSALELALQALRTEWVERPESFERRALAVQATLPPGLVSHVAVLDAQGRVVFNSQGGGLGTDVSDRPYFKQLRETRRLVVSPPVLGRVSQQWQVQVGLPVLREGRFDGTVNLAVPAEQLSRRLARLSLSDQDIVALLHADRSYVARSVDNTRAMGQQVAAEGPFAAGAGRAGVYRRPGQVDGVLRLYGWYRLPGAELVVVVGLSEDAALARGQQPSRLLTLAFTAALLALGGGLMAHLVRLDRAATARRGREQRLRAALEGAHLAQWDYDFATRELRGSPAFYRLCGLDPDAFLSGQQAFFAVVHPDDVAGVRLAFRQAVQAHRSLDTVCRVVRPSDGATRHLRLLATQVYDGRRALSSHGSAQDITGLRVGTPPTEAA